MTSLLPLPIKTANHAVFEKSSSLKKILIFIDYNIKNPAPYNKIRENKKATELLCSIDQLSINSWNEIICQSQQGMLLDTTLLTIINGLQREGPTFNPDVFYNQDKCLY